MKKLIIFGIFLVMISSIFAHPAHEVSVDYSFKTKLLTVDFEHSVRYPEKHYISQVQVEVHDQVIITQLLSQQDNTGGGKLVFRLANLQKGDLVKVTTKCSEYGDKSIEYVVK